MRTRFERPLHDALGLLLILTCLAALWGHAALSKNSECWLNHSGVQECASEAPGTWRPTDTTGGADIVL